MVTLQFGWHHVKAITVDVVRHALPLTPFYLTHGSSTSYLLLTAFDLSLGFMLIVGTARDAKDPTTVDPRATWLISRLAAVVVGAIFLGIVAAILSLPLGIPAFIFGWWTGVDWHALVMRKPFWISAAVMALVTGARAQLRFEATTNVGKWGTSLHEGPVVGDLAGDRRTSKAAYAAQVTLIATYVVLSFGLIIFGRHGFYIFPALFAALLVFYDARPDIGQRIFPELWSGGGITNLPDTIQTIVRSASHPHAANKPEDNPNPGKGSARKVDFRPGDRPERKN
ncbi:MAG: hypothetical protein M3R59_09595 [Verrucomicrobiota bacterium]|nr:hypothetical protein [Verrucomicrobiota bacterium]